MSQSETTMSAQSEQTASLVPHVASMSNAKEPQKSREGERGRIGRLAARNKLITFAVIASVLCSVYWLFWASNRYVSESHIVIERTSLAGGQTMDFSSLLSGTMSGSRADQLLLRDYLRSMDMLVKLDAALNLRAHYSDRKRDVFSRLWSRNAPRPSLSIRPFPWCFY